MLSYAIHRKIYGFSADYWNTYPSKVMGVSVEDVNRFARKYLKPDAIQIVVVGDAEKIRSGLEKYGPVEVYHPNSR